MTKDELREALHRDVAGRGFTFVAKLKQFGYDLFRTI